MQRPTETDYQRVGARLAERLGAEAVLRDPLSRTLYEYDGGVDQARPDLVVFPGTREQVQEVVRLAAAERMPLIPRGAGTGLSGGALARQGGIVLCLNRMNHILELDWENGRAVVEPGVINLDLTEAVRPHGFAFAPDPSSQSACTIGGNVAENSGGPHTLAYGVTVNHVTGLEAVLADGRFVQTGGWALDSPGYDLTGVLVGSEGTLAIVTAITVKLTRLPEAVRTLLAIYARIEDAAESITSITAAGITPAALEMLDGFTLRAVEDYVHAGYPLDSAAVLLIEVEGLGEEVEDQQARVREICLACGAREARVARDAGERARLWKGRKSAFGAVGRISPNYYVMDGVIPRTRIARILREIERIGARYGLRIGNIFHAGDGNLHPLVFYDARQPEQLRRALAASRDIIRLCMDCGGSISGEHGIGMEKDELMPWMFSAADLDFMRQLQGAFHSGQQLNPGKLLPSFRACREIRSRAAWQPLSDESGNSGEVRPA